MNQKDNHNLTEIHDLLTKELKEINNKLDKMDRAIYGDAENQVLGLIDYNKEARDSMKDIEERVHTLEKIKSSMKYYISGLATAASLGGASVWEWITRMK